MNSIISICRIFASALVIAPLSLILIAFTFVEALAVDPSLESLYAKVGKLQKGMTPNEVRAVLGSPSNRSDEPVWLWVSAAISPKTGVESWKSLAERDHEGGVFLVFRDEKLVLPSLRSLAVCGPDEILIEHGNLKPNNVEDVYKLSPKRP